MEQLRGCTGSLQFDRYYIVHTSIQETHLCDFKKKEQEIGGNLERRLMAADSLGFALSLSISFILFLIVLF